MKKIVFLVLGVMLIGFCLSSMPSSATGDETENVPLWIDTTYRIDFVNMTTMNISTTFAVHEICIDENNFTAEAIRENYTLYPGVGRNIINKTVEEIDTSFNTIINTAFANDTLEKCEDTTVDESTIIGVAPSGDEYQPPINFTKNATITFNMTSFGFEENPDLNLDDVIRGVLKMGAVITKTFQLKADAGYKNMFILIFSEDIKPTSVEDEDFLDTTVTWTVDNLKATDISERKETSGNLIIESSDPLSTFDQNINIYTYIDINHFDNRTELGHQGIDINATIDIGSINISKYEDMLPNTVSNLTFITPDGIRMAVKNNLTTWDEIENKTVGESKSNAEETLSNMFNSTIRLVFEWDNNSRLKGYDVDTMTGDPVISYMNTTESAGFSSSSFDLDENASVHNVMIGVLKMGAVVEKEIEMKVSANTKNTIEFAFPDGVTSDNQIWEMDNLKDSTEKVEEKTLTIQHENPNPVTDEELLTNLTLDVSDFDELYLYGTVDIKSVNITKYNVSLPSNIRNLSYISSDGLRMALENNLVTWEDIENEINKTKKNVEEMLNSTFNATITLNLTWYNLEGYNLSEMGAARAINATFVGFNETKSKKIKPNLFSDFDSETITGLLNAGAKVSFEISAAEQNYTIKMILPENMIFSGYSQKVEHTIITNRNAYSWSSSETLSSTLESGIAPEYNESMALLNVLVDMHDVDIFGMLLSVDLNADAQVYHIELSDVDMPKNITMKYINSDCLRLLYAKDIIKQSDIDNITNEIKNSLEENLTNSLGGNVSISVHLDQDSLTGYDVNNMKDDRPVSISAEAHISISLEQASSNRQAMTISYLTFPLEFPLSGMEGFNTTYKIILPKGINVIQCSDTLNRLKSGTEDGRTYLTVTLNENEEDTLSITIDATGLVLNIMLPFIILGIIIPVVSIIAKLMMRKERKLE